MSGVYKYVLDKESIQELELPRRSKILSVEEQYDNIVLYALIDTEEDEFVKFQVIVLGTGHEYNLTEDDKFIGTVKFYNGTLMLHVFIRGYC